MVAVAQRLDRRLDDMRRRFEIRLADPQIDDVLAFCRKCGRPRQHGEGVFLADAVEGRNSLEHPVRPSGSFVVASGFVSVDGAIVKRNGGEVNDDLKNWQGRPRPAREPLEGRYVRLEPLNAKRHGDGLYEASSVADAGERFRWLPDVPPKDRADFQPWLDRVEASEDPLFFTVIDKASGKIAGRQTLMRIDAANGVIEIGNIYWGPLISRKPAATEAQFLFMQYAFDRLGYRRYEWKCNNRNEPSKRAALRFGFSFEGIFRQNMVVKGENRDTAWYSIIDKEWPALKRAYQEWLDPANFAADGTAETAARRDQGRARGIDWQQCSIATTITTTTMGTIMRHSHGGPRPRSHAWRDRQDARADRRSADRRLHGRRGDRRLPHGIAGAGRRRRPHARRLDLAGARLVRLPSRRPRCDRPAHLWLRPRQDAGRLHQRPCHLRHRAVDRLRGVAALPRAGAYPGRADAGGGGGRAAGQHRRLLRAAWRRPRQPQHARRHPACAGRHAGLGRRDRRRAGHPGDRAGRRSIRSCRCWSRCSSCRRRGR